MNLWWVGAILSIIGSICSNLGVNIQKFSFMKNQKKPHEKQKGYSKQPLWWLGMFMVFFGSLGDFAALGLAAQSIVAPIGSTTLVANLLFAQYGLGEKISKKDLIGTFLILLGCTLAVAFGNHNDATYTISELRSLYGGIGFISYACVTAIICSTLYAFLRRVTPIKLQIIQAIKLFDQAIMNENAQLASEEEEKISQLELRYSRYARFHPFAYCALSGIFGANSILFGKMVALMLATSIGGDNQMVQPLTYVFLLCMLVCVFSQLHFLAIGLSFFDALYVVPVFQCFWITVSTIGGALYFGEFAAFDIIQCFMFPAGILLTLYGVYLLSSRKMNKPMARDGLEQLRLTIEQREASESLYDPDSSADEKIPNNNAGPGSYEESLNSIMLIRSPSPDRGELNFDNDSNALRMTPVSKSPLLKNNRSINSDDQNDDSDSFTPVRVPHRSVTMPVLPSPPAHLQAQLSLLSSNQVQYSSIQQHSPSPNNSNFLSPTTALTSNQMNVSPSVSQASNGSGPPGARHHRFASTSFNANNLPPHSSNFYNNHYNHNVFNDSMDNENESVDLSEIPLPPGVLGWIGATNVVQSVTAIDLMPKRTYGSGFVNSQMRASIIARRDRDLQRQRGVSHGNSAGGSPEVKPVSNQTTNNNNTTPNNQTQKSATESPISLTPSGSPNTNGYTPLNQASENS